MCILPKAQILIYGLGDEGYGSIRITKDFTMCEYSSGIEKDKLSVAKTSMYVSKQGDGFIWKVGGYTAVTGAGGHQGTKKTSCFISMLKSAENGDYRVTQ